MTKHTPGPWNYEHTEDEKRIIIGKALVEGPDGYDVAEVYSDDCDSEEALANAQLIAAAPETAAERDRLKEINAELLHAIKQASIAMAGTDWPVRKVVGAAIAKAEAA